MDTVATVSADDFRQALEVLAADEEVHAIIALVLRTGATGDLLSAIEDAELGVPLAVVVLNQPEAVRHARHPARQGPRLRLPGGGGPGARPRRAVRAVARHAARGAARPSPTWTQSAAASSCTPSWPPVPDGGWLPEAEVVALLGHYGLSLAPAAEARAGDDVVAIGVTDDQMFGPLVMLGPAGPATEPPAGRAARLAPLTSADADMLINSIRSGPLSPSHPGAPARGPAAVSAALRDALLRVSRLTDDLPEIAELDLNPVIARPEGAVVVDARIRVAPQLPQDPFLREAAVTTRWTASLRSACRPGSRKPAGRPRPGRCRPTDRARARTATAAVGKADGGSDDGSARPTVSSAMPGLWPITSAVRHSGRNSRTSISRPSTVASYTRDS